MIKEKTLVQLGILATIVALILMANSGWNLFSPVQYRYRCDCTDINICHQGVIYYMEDAPVGNHFRAPYECLIWMDYVTTTTTTTTSPICSDCIVDSIPNLAWVVVGLAVVLGLLVYFKEHK